MLDFLLPKSKIQAFNLREVPIEHFEVIGIGQINPYCNIQYDNEIFLTVVNFVNESKNFDEKEGLIIAKYFSVRRCPRCKKTELIPVKMHINMDLNYLKNEEEIAFDAYEEHPSRRHFPTLVSAYCNHCNSCFEIRIKNKDTWIKQAKRIKEKDLVTRSWEEYNTD
ncbi:MAG: hypothetical protein IJ003_05980 [Candidatus Gastranaerophilales bacterium]|nr:hypothetical protein [Candidatus Gastranaerophilales bacterium]